MVDDFSVYGYEEQSDIDLVIPYVSSNDPEWQKRFH